MINRILSHRATRILLGLFITLFTLSVLLVVWINWSGKRRWVAAKALVEREGETLDYRKLLPAAPKPEINLLAIEPLDGIAEVVGQDEARGDSGAKRKELAGLAWQSGKVKMPRTQGTSLAQKAGFAEWVQMARAAKLVDVTADSPDAGRELLKALDVKFPVLKQLADEAVKHPQAMFTPTLSERELPGMLFSLQIPHYTIAQKLGINLALRARAASAAGEGVEVGNSLVAMFRVAQACKAEPMLIGFLVGMTVDAQALEVLWEVLEMKLLKDDELRLLQHTLAACNLEPALLLSMRGEMAVGIGSLEYLQDVVAGRKKGGKEIADLLSVSSSSALQKGWLGAFPSGMFGHWMSAVAEVEMRHLIQPLKTGGLRSAVDARGALERELEEHGRMPWHPDYIMVNLMVPSFSHISQSALMVQTRLRQADVALALERCHLKSGTYPTRLDALVPEFLAAVPSDPCDGKEMRYRVTEGGRYSLWSVALDGRDDGGKVSVTKPEDTRLMTKPGYLGDWAWQYESMK